MIPTSFAKHLASQLDDMVAQNLFKKEAVITSPQASHIKTDAKDMINACANNYLGLADHPALVDAAKSALDDYGFGMASVRFICGTQAPHKKLEEALSKWLGLEDCILYSSCFDANGGIFETLLTAEDAVISDALNHASIIDGIRLCKAKRFRYDHDDMASLEAQLQAADAQEARFKLIVTDGVFSMDGTIANLPAICDLAERYDALVMIDDCHSSGFLGEHGRGTHEYHDVMGRVDIISSTLGKALGGASGGFVCASKAIVGLLRQRSRPYLFSNALAPMITGASLKVLELIEQKPELRAQLWKNTERVREALPKMGFDIIPGKHPIIPVMLGDAQKAVQLSQILMENGVLAVAFSYPVVPKGKARVRLQMSGGMDDATVDQLLKAFAIAAKTMALPA